MIENKEPTPIFEPIAKNPVYVLSAPTLKSCPVSELPEICLMGRSNVGKSSLINGLVNRKNLARTSNQPGKTQAMNYYDMDGRYYFVDLPGYGYAKVSQKLRMSWERNMAEFLINRKQLQLVIHIVDARHEPSAKDKEYFYWLAEQELPYLIVLSKADKISKNEGSKRKAEVRKLLSKMNIEVPVILVSAEKARGLDELIDYIKEFSS
jgi:GTP-binding protein